MALISTGDSGRIAPFLYTHRAEGVERVYVAPGNAGTALEPNVENVDIGVGEFERLAEFAATTDVGLTIVGPEVPLVAGIRDFFDERGLRCFGPRKAAAE